MRNAGCAITGCPGTYGPKPCVFSRILVHTRRPLAPLLPFRSRPAPSSEAAPIPRALGHTNPRILPAADRPPEPPHPIGRLAKDAHRRPQKSAPHAAAPPVGGAEMPPDPAVPAGTPVGVPCGIPLGMLPRYSPRLRAGRLPGHFRRRIRRRDTVPSIDGMTSCLQKQASCHAADRQHDTVPPIGGAVPPGRIVPPIGGTA